MSFVAPASASLAGDTVTLNINYPNKNTFYESLGEQIISPHYTNIFALPFATVFFYVTGTSFQIQDNLPGPFFWEPASFNGVQLLDLTKADITNVSVDQTTNLADFASRVSFDSSDIFVNMQDILLEPDTTIKLDIATTGTAIPEPSSLSIDVLGLGLLGAFYFGRKKA